MAVVGPKPEVLEELLKMFGLQNLRVRSLTIKVAHNAAVTVSGEMYVDEAQLKAFTHTFAMTLKE